MVVVVVTVAVAGVGVGAGGGRRVRRRRVRAVAGLGGRHCLMFASVVWRMRESQKCEEMGGDAFEGGGDQVVL